MVRILSNIHSAFRYYATEIYTKVVVVVVVVKWAGPDGCYSRSMQTGGRGGGGGIEATIVRGRKPQRITQTEKVQLRTGGETASW